MQIRRFARGCHSILGIFLHPVGRFLGPLLDHLRTPERLERGLVLVLPGIEAESCLNHGIARGLADGGVDAAIEIFDWTTGIILLFWYHLRGWRRNVAQAERLVRRIIAYQAAYPGRAVHLVGHSGGGAMTILALERLPAGVVVTNAVLLQAAISPGYNLVNALRHSTRGIYNFSSLRDIFFLGIGSCIAATVDGRFTPAAGMIGFRLPGALTASEREIYSAKLHEMPFRPAMIASFHLGGHMGAANRVFVAEWIAPLLKPDQAAEPGSVSQRDAI